MMNMHINPTALKSPSSLQIQKDSTIRVSIDKKLQISIARELMDKLGFKKGSLLPCSTVQRESGQWEVRLSKPHPQNISAQTYRLLCSNAYRQRIIVKRGINLKFTKHQWCDTQWALDGDVVVIEIPREMTQ